MSGEQKDLTQKEAAALAEAKWGYGARAVLSHQGKRLRVRHVYDAFAGSPQGGSSFTSWREACERAGLLETETATR